MDSSSQFVFPRALKDLEEDNDDNYEVSRLRARSPIDVASLRASELEEFVKGSAIHFYLRL